MLRLLHSDLMSPLLTVRLERLLVPALDVGLRALELLEQVSVTSLLVGFVVAPLLALDPNPSAPGRPV
ncbi:MAG: hypothetical protein JJ863_21275 [Deltaproteobacteria bacterium]|nr:hypothetical protein [Deltaproteobacteria bacterium]